MPVVVELAGDFMVRGEPGCLRHRLSNQLGCRPPSGAALPFSCDLTVGIWPPLAPELHAPRPARPAVLCKRPSPARPTQTPNPAPAGRAPRTARRRCSATTRACLCRSPGRPPTPCAPSSTPRWGSWEGMRWVGGCRGCRRDGLAFASSFGVLTCRVWGAADLAGEEHPRRVTQATRALMDMCTCPRKHSETLHRLSKPPRNRPGPAHRRTRARCVWASPTPSAPPSATPPTAASTSTAATRSASRPPRFGGEERLGWSASCCCFCLQRRMPLGCFTNLTSHPHLTFPRHYSFKHTPPPSP
jgi:hypothetical protein